MTTDTANGIAPPRLPQYQSHKIVEAARIAHIETSPPERPPNEAIAITVEAGSEYELIRVSDAWADRHNPKVGGYFVRYASGYESYSPTEAFESGYEAIPPEPETRGEGVVGPFNPPKGGFQDKLTTLINEHSIEGGSNTPDFILAEFLRQCLEAFDMTTRQRDEWWGIADKTRI